MYDKTFIAHAIERSATTEVDRRNLLAMVGLAGAGVATSVLASGGAANAAPSYTGGQATDLAVLNFALNLEYLEAEFYYVATTGHHLPSSLTDGSGNRGTVSGGRMVNFMGNKLVQNYANEIANDEVDHVKFLRTALGSKYRVARPSIDIGKAFSAAATAAGVIKAGQTFDPYANPTNFLLAAFIFEDVGVTAYKGAAGLITNKTYLDAAAGILAVEAYHAGIIRSTLYAEASQAGNSAIFGIVDKISNVRDAVDGPSDDDQGIGTASASNLVPTDSNSIAFGRPAADVLNVVYLNNKSVTKGGFYPNGVNGAIHQSAAN